MVFTVIFGCLYLFLMLVSHKVILKDLKKKTKNEKERAEKQKQMKEDLLANHGKY